MILLKGWGQAAWVGLCVLKAEFWGRLELPFVLWGCPPSLYLGWGLVELWLFRIPVSAVASLSTAGVKAPFPK